LVNEVRADRGICKVPQTTTNSALRLQTCSPPLLWKKEHTRVSLLLSKWGLWWRGVKGRPWVSRRPTDGAVPPPQCACPPPHTAFVNDICIKITKKNEPEFNDINEAG
jgi:hypothetical protein